jgi:hypothetical protein
MSSFWRDAAERTDRHNTEEDFATAAYRLVCEQVLYHADRGDRIHYGLVERFERDFARALDPLGMTVRVNRQLQYAVALPRHIKSGTANQGQTLLALVLLQIFDENARQGRLNERGEVPVDLVELEQRYRLLLNRDFPTKGELDVCLKQLARWGLVRRAYEEEALPVDGVEQPYSLLVRPAIGDVLGETALQRLANWATPAEAGAAEALDVDVDERTSAAEDTLQ